MMSFSLQLAAFIPSRTLALALALALCPVLSDAKVYQWTDAEGNVQFSDRPQEAAQAPDRSRQDQAGPAVSDLDAGLAVRVVAVDCRLTDRVQGMLEAIPPALYRIVRKGLGLHLPPPQTLTVRLLPQRDAYERAVGAERAQTAPEGLYQREAHEILTWYHPNADIMAQVVAGETGRALLQARFPHAPRWLREGLARYFELLRVVGGTTTVFPNPRLEQEARVLQDADKLMPTAQLLSLPEGGWPGAPQDGEQTDVQSWSLVYFLLSLPEGGALIGEILRQAQTAERAGPVSTQVIDAQFAGGVEALDRRWRAWLVSQKPSHYY